MESTFEILLPEVCVISLSRERKIDILIVWVSKDAWMFENMH